MNKTLNSFASLEWNDETSIRIHIHGMIEKPIYIGEGEFNTMMKKNWYEVSQDTGFVHIENVTTDDWGVYILKLKTKDSKVEFSENIHYVIQSNGYHVTYSQHCLPISDQLVT